MVAWVGGHLTVHFESPDLAIVRVFAHQIVYHYEGSIILLVLKHEPRCASVRFVSFQRGSDQILIPDAHSLSHVE